MRLSKSLDGGSPLSVEHSEQKYRCRFQFWPDTICTELATCALWHEQQNLMAGMYSGCNFEVLTFVIFFAPMHSF
jgi:hypothetical protein